ncbi:MAG: hypothetical protein KF906_01215 [Actinobacteria bacterium]|nr:hypothetical protein [Actinomycetota bacterium]
MAPDESTDTDTRGSAEEPEVVQVMVPTSLHSPKVEIARRVGIVLALAFGVFLLIKAAERDDTTIPDTTGNARVVAQSPLPDAQAPSQTQVGVDLAEGFDGRLTIAGTPIPEDQLDGARDPATLTEEQLRKYGIRPNNRNHLYFTPGPDKVLEEIPKGEVTVIVTYFRDRQPDVDAGTYSWTFTVQ